MLTFLGSNHQVKVLKINGSIFFYSNLICLWLTSSLANYIFKPPRFQYMCETNWDQHLFHANSGFLKTALCKI